MKIVLVLAFTILAYIVATSVLQMIIPTECYAQAAADTAASQNLDLSSTEKVIPVPTDMPLNTAITIAGASHTVSPSDMLTPAEHVALTQVLASGQQSLMLGAAGAAVGGNFTINAALAQNINNLVIPSGVSAIQDAANLSQLTLVGNLVNSGQFHVISTNNQITSAFLQAANIQNNAGAYLGTLMPTGGLPGVTTTVSNLSLTLSAINNIVNAGMIASSGNLTLAAGGTITNSATGNMLAVMQATNNVNMIANNIVNQGIIASLASNINIASTMASNLTVNNISGQLSALAGSINIGNPAFSGKFNTIVNGGNLASRQLNIYSGNGIASVNVNELLGRTNICAGEAHVSTSGNALQLGTLQLTGDPTFYNRTGDVVVNSDLIFSGQDLAIIAAGDIRTSEGTIIDTSSADGKGGNVLIVAGANFSSSSGSLTSLNTTDSLTIFGASSSGGTIELGSGLEPKSLSTGGTNDQPSGNVTMVAFFGNNTDSGKVLLSQNMLIDTGNNSAGNAGNVDIFASAPNGQSVTIGNINTSSTNGSSGTITITAATTNVSSESVVVTNGSIDQTFGTFVTSDLASGKISTGSLNAAGATIAVATLGKVTVDENAIWQANNIYITTTHLSNAGSITSLASPGYIFVTSPNALTLDGAGSFTLTGNNGSTAQFTASGANPIDLNASWTFNGQQFVSFAFSADNDGGSIIVGDNTTQTINGGAYFGLAAPTVIFGANTTLWATGVSILEIASFHLAQQIIIPTNSTTAVHTERGGYIAVGTYSQNTLQVSRSAGDGNATIAFSGGDVYTWSNGANTTIDAGVIFSSDSGITMNIDGGTLVNNGTITSSAVDGHILLSGYDSNLTLQGSSQGVVSVTGGGYAEILIRASGPDHTVTIQSSPTISAGPEGTVVIMSDYIVIGDNQSLNAVDGSKLATFSRTLVLGRNSNISASNTINLFASGDPCLQIVLPNSSVATLATNAGTINIQGEALLFVSSGQTDSTLQIKGGPLFTTAGYGDLTISNAVTIRADDDMQFYVGSGHSFIDSGTIISSKFAGPSSKR